MADIKIIDNPSLKSFFQHISEWSFTFFMWGLWIYLFLPLLNIIIWVISGHYFYETVIAEENYRQLFTILRKGWIAIVVIFLIIRGWGLYNYYRFGRLNRRKPRPHVTKKQLADYFGITEDEVSTFQAQKEIKWERVYVPENQRGEK